MFPDPYAYLPRCRRSSSQAAQGAHQYVSRAAGSSGAHEYYLTVTALSVAKTGLDENAARPTFGFAIAGPTLARATLICPTPAPAT